MASNRRFKELYNKLMRRFSPFMFKELLRFLKISQLFYCSDKRDGLAPLWVCKPAWALNTCMMFLVTRSKPFGRLCLSHPKSFCYGVISLLPGNRGSALCRSGAKLTGTFRGRILGVTTDICSFHRSAIGHVFWNTFPKNILQVATTTLCDNNTKTMKICETVSKKETIVIDVPYEADEYSVAYLAKQLEDFTRRLEEITGKKMTQESFAKAIDYSNKTREKILEVNELRKDPLSSQW
ncbi:MAG: 2-hydroxyacyl-CoA dehydratase family protein [Candidatus Brocadiaceae bacterium]